MKAGQRGSRSCHPECSERGRASGIMSFPRPPALVPRLDLLHHFLKRLIQIDPFPIGHADQHEENIRHLHREVALGLVRLLGLPPEAMVDLPRQLAHFLGQPGEIGERIEVALLELGDPGVYPALGFG